MFVLNCLNCNEEYSSERERLFSNRKEVKKHYENKILDYSEIAELGITLDETQEKELSKIRRKNTKKSLENFVRKVVVEKVIEEHQEAWRCLKCRQEEDLGECGKCGRTFRTNMPKGFGKRTLQRMAEEKINKGGNEKDVEKWVLETKKSWRCDVCKELVGGNENKSTKRKNRSRRKKKKFKSLENRIEKVEDIVYCSKKLGFNIYNFDTVWHLIGWPIFLILVGYILKKVRHIRKRKVKITQNYLVEIRAIFQEWQLNMYVSTAGYVVGFYLIQQAINKWINPRISNWLITQKLITLSVVSLIIGIGFYVDGIITSSLKTPLQRLSIKIENAEIEEKVKKSLLSKTQKVNELFKETLKRFGLLAVVGILTNLIKEFWNEHLLTLLSYAVPIAGALKIIWEVDKSLKKLKLGGSKKN